MHRALRLDSKSNFWERWRWWFNLWRARSEVRRRSDAGAPRSSFLLVCRLTVSVCTRLHPHNASCKSELVNCAQRTHKRKTRDVNGICTHRAEHSHREQTFVQRVSENKVSKLLLIDLIWDITTSVNTASLCVNVFTCWWYDKIIQFFNYHCVHDYILIWVDCFSFRGPVLFCCKYCVKRVRLCE